MNEAGSGEVRRSGAGRSAGRSGITEAATPQFWQRSAAIGWAFAQRRFGMLAEDQDTQDIEDVSDEDVDELLVEEISIDGMCGVY